MFDLLVHFRIFENLFKKTTLIGQFKKGYFIVKGKRIHPYYEIKILLFTIRHVKAFGT